MCSSLRSLVLVIGALTAGLVFVSAAPVEQLEKRVVLGGILDGCPLGSYSHNGHCVPINACLFASTRGLLDVNGAVNIANIANLRLDLDKVLDITSNTCLSVDSCLLLKSNTIVSHTLAGIVDVRVCQKKTCPHISILNIDTGICQCPLDNIFADKRKTRCIKKADCSPILHDTIDGICIPKVCAAGKVILGGALHVNLLAQVGQCVDASLCHVISNGVCTTLKADLTFAVNAAAGILTGVKATVDGKVAVKIGL